jgi:hypothetical protein
MKSQAMVGLMLVGLGFVIRPAAADILEVTPAKAVVVPSQKDGWTRVALEFDLSTMQSGIGRAVLWAYVEWRIESVDKGQKEFSAYPILVPWAVEQAAVSSDAPLSSADEAADWLLTPQEQEKGGCLLRLVLTDVVGDWAAGRTGNYGVVVATRDMSAAVLSEQFANARLVVGYTFRGE